MAGLGSAFSRLSRREKTLVGSLLGVLLLGVVFVFNLVVGSQVSELETRIDEDRATLRKIYAKSSRYLDARAKTEALHALAGQNKDVNLKLAINELAKKVSFEALDRNGNPTGTRRLSDIMQYQQTQETFLSKKKKKKKKKKGDTAKNVDETIGYYRRDQKVTFSDTVPFTAVFEFLSQLEAARDMMFVTDIELKRDFREGGIAQRNANVVVSTWYYKGREDKGDEDDEDDGGDDVKGAGAKGTGDRAGSE